MTCGVEQWLARQTHNLKVGGSNPPSATKKEDEMLIRFGNCADLIPEKCDWCQKEFVEDDNIVVTLRSSKSSEYDPSGNIDFNWDDIEVSAYHGKERRDSFSCFEHHCLG